MDGLFEIVIIALILLAPLIEGAFKKGKARREEEAARGRGSAPDRDAEWESEAREGRRDRAGASGPPDRAETPGSPYGGGPVGSDRDAEVLLPDDLWEVLTGQRPTRAETGRSEARGAELEREESRTEQDFGFEPAPAPVPGESAPGGADLGGMLSPGERDESTRTHFPEPTRRPTPATPGEAGAIGRREIGTGGEITRSGRELQLRRARLGRVARRGGRPAGGRAPHPYFRDVDLEDLRRAVVMKEVLGPPLALRGERPDR